MKIGISLKPHLLDDLHLSYFRGLGCESVVPWVPLPAGDGVWHVEDLQEIKERITRHGMQFAAIECLNPGHWDRIALDEPGKEQQMRNLCQTIRNMGQVGIPCLSYNFSICGVQGYYSERDNHDGRGGARVKKFDVHRIPHSEPPDNRSFWFESIQAPGLFRKDLEHRSPQGKLPTVNEAQMWERVEYFLSHAVPAAEKAGVVLAAHPDDPPVPELRGSYRLLHSVENLQRLLDLVPSPNNCLTFCQGTISTMKGVNIIQTIRRFASQNKIAWVHFRNTRGGYPRWQEVFIDEGDIDMIEAMKTYLDNGFDGTMIPDHTPYLDLPGELWWETGMAFGLGYMQGIRRALGTYT